MKIQTPQLSMRISLRYKLLILLTSLPLVSLTLYLFMATKLFEEDKVAYVFDASVAASRSLATATRMELENFQSTFKPLVEQLDLEEGKFNSIAHELFNGQTRIEYFLIDFRSNNNTAIRSAVLKKPTDATKKFSNEAELLKLVRGKLGQQNPVLVEFQSAGPYVLIGQRLQSSGFSGQVVGVFRSETLSNAFNGKGLYKSFLSDSQVRMQIGVAESDVADLSEQSLARLKKLLAGNAPQATAKLRLKNGTEYLTSFSAVGQGDLNVISMVSRADALRAVQLMISKSILFFVALIAATLIASVFASAQMTSTLRELFEATKKIASGQFDVRVGIHSSDEVGGLAKSFNWMAGEVSRLLSETAEKARMENELATVRTVQETLFPKSEANFGPIRIVGHFEPASECGGDWWSYSKVGDRLYLWIGDATGHGAPAALITSAARSAVAVIESLPEMKCHKALSVLNRAIHETSKGQIMMTFFLGCIDFKNMSLTYANASHDPPYFIRSREGKSISKKDLVPLMEKIGPRLGEKRDTEYEEVCVQLEPGDSLVFYTDGILDIDGIDGKNWGERDFLRALVKASQGQAKTLDKLTEIKTSLNEHRQGVPLKDDITLFICDFEKTA